MMHILSVVNETWHSRKDSKNIRIILTISMLCRQLIIVLRLLTLAALSSLSCLIRKISTQHFMSIFHSIERALESRIVSSIITNGKTHCIWYYET